MEKPILFSTEMVQAILAGRKTMTRRVVKPQQLIKGDGSLNTCFMTNHLWKKVHKEMPMAFGPIYFCPYQIGTVLWVKETWRVVKVDDIHKKMLVDYLADKSERVVKFSTERYDKFRKFYKKNGWQSSLFIPREASKLLLKVTNIRFERLQEITERDAMKEGFLGYYDSYADEQVTEATDDFVLLWDSLNKHRGYGWDSDPWVWVVEFEITRVDGESHD